MGLPFRIGIVTLALLPVPANAQTAGPRPIIASADAPFLHKNSGLTLPVTLAGLPRTQIREFEAPELDIVGTWTRGDESELSVYVYRSTAGSAPLWFDRAVWAIESRGLYGKPTPVQVAAPIRAPGADTNGGLIASWTASSGPYKGTGVVIVPVGEWLVKLRYSSKTADGGAAAALLRTALAGVGWPARMPSAPAAQPVVDCATPLAVKGEAKSVKPDMSSMIMGAFAGLAVASPVATRAALWCRDASPLPNTGLYRPAGADDRYLIALSDAGRGVVVGPGMGGLVDPKAKPRWSVDLVTPGRTLNYPQQDRLPSPQRVARLLKAAPVSNASSWGDKRVINLGVAPK